MSERGTAAPPAVDEPQRRQVDVVVLGVAQQVVPDGGNPERQGRALLGDDPGQRLGLEEALGEDEVGPGEERRVGHAPGVGVEHGHDDEDAVLLAGAHAVGRSCPAKACSHVERWL